MAHPTPLSLTVCLAQKTCHCPLGCLPLESVNFTELGTMLGDVEETMTKSLSSGDGIRQVHQCVQGKA